MSPLTIASTALACTRGSATLGQILNVILPRHHLDADFRDVIKLMMGLLATLSALVLGLLIASGQNSRHWRRSAR